MSLAARMLLWITNVLTELKVIYRTPIIKCDNQGAIKLVENPLITKYSKHIDIKYHFIRQLYMSRKINVEYCPTNDMIADIFTKPLQATRFQTLREQLHRPPLQGKILHR